MTEGYCMKCKKKREMTNDKEVTIKSGMRALQGVCSECGTKMFKMLGRK